jgi:hypothetical protein
MPVNEPPRSTLIISQRWRPQTVEGAEEIDSGRMANGFACTALFVGMHSQTFRYCK